MDKKTTEYNNILNELIRAVKTLQLYSIGHPNLDANLEKYLVLLKSATDKYGDIAWKIDHKGFYFHEDTQLLEKQPAVEQLAREFFTRRITQLVITPRVTLSDLKNFLTMLTVNAREFLMEGGIEKFLAKRHVEGILVNEMDLDALKKLIDELEEEEEEEEEEFLEEEEEEEEEEIEEEEDDGLTEEERSLNMLLKEIAEEKDSLKYNDLSHRVVEKSTELIHDKKFTFVLNSLKLFNKHTKEDSGLSENLMEVAEERLKDLLRKELLYHLVSEIIIQQEEDEIDEVGEILIHGGKEAQNILLDYLLECKSASDRKRLFHIVTLFGDDVRSEIELRLSDSRWFAVRQMAALLGELGGEESLVLLERTFKHPELRVRREVLKAFSKFNSKRAFEFLLTTLNDKEPAVQAQAALSLGLTKRPEAVEPLGKIASKKEAFQELSELKKEAIKALGILGHESAVPWLEKILKAKAWFGKKALDEQRALAVNSLGKIGGKETIRVLGDACENLEGNTYDACKRLLEGASK